MKILQLLFSKKKKDPVSDRTVQIPFHIEQVGRMYPVLHLVAGNKSTGTIKKFLLDTNKLRPGQALITKGSKSVWVHLGNDFFKNIMEL